jgi:hypothetical protein
MDEKPVLRLRRGTPDTTPLQKELPAKEAEAFIFSWGTVLEITI